MSVEAGIAGAAVAGMVVVGGWSRTQWSTSQILGKTFVNGPNGRELALTFDDGPNDRYTQEVLEKLHLAQVKASFFFIGRHARELPWLVRQVQEAGHLIGNHTMTHPKLTFLGHKEIFSELRDCKALLEDLTGAPVHYFRPPFGGRRPAVMKIAEELGMKTIMWNSMGSDWRPSQPPKQIMKAVERGIRKNRKAGIGTTILLHDGGHAGPRTERARTVAAVGFLLERGHAAGYRFVPVSEWWPPAQA